VSDNHRHDPAPANTSVRQVDENPKTKAFEATK